jgi:hypothetical protein
MIQFNRYEIAMIDRLVAQRLRGIPSEIHHTSIHGFREDLEREFEQLEVLAAKIAQEQRSWVGGAEYVEPVFREDMEEAAPGCG